jgi:hypothetical protein
LKGSKRKSWLLYFIFTDLRGRGPFCLACFFWEIPELLPYPSGGGGGRPSCRPPPPASETPLCGGLGMKKKWRDLVDTWTHASRIQWHNVTEQPFCPPIRWVEHQWKTFKCECQFMWCWANPMGHTHTHYYMVKMKKGSPLNGKMKWWLFGV